MQVNDFQMLLCAFRCVGKFLDVNLRIHQPTLFPLSTDALSILGPRLHRLLEMESLLMKCHLVTEERFKCFNDPGAMLLEAVCP